MRARYRLRGQQWPMRTRRPSRRQEQEGAPAAVTLVLSLCLAAAAVAGTPQCGTGTCEADDAWEAERAAVRGRVPVVFMHWTMEGCHHCQALPDFLSWAVRAAVAAGNHVVLVGDEPTRKLQGAAVTWVPVAALQPATKALDDVYQHASSNAESYERGCMQVM